MVRSIAHDAHCTSEHDHAYICGDFCEAIPSSTKFANPSPHWACWQGNTSPKGGVHSTTSGERQRAGKETKVEEGTAAVPGSIHD